VGKREKPPLMEVFFINRHLLILSTGGDLSKTIKHEFILTSFAQKKKVRWGKLG
jgi:hypothetical protein